MVDRKAERTPRPHAGLSDRRDLQVVGQKTREVNNEKNVEDEAHVITGRNDASHELDRKKNGQNRLEVAPQRVEVDHHVVVVVAFGPVANVVEGVAVPERKVEGQLALLAERARSHCRIRRAGQHGVAAGVPVPEVVPDAVAVVVGAEELEPAVPVGRGPAPVEAAGVQFVLGARGAVDLHEQLALDASLVVVDELRARLPPEHENRRHDAENEDQVQDARGAAAPGHLQGQPDLVLPAVRRRRLLDLFDVVVVAAPLLQLGADVNVLALKFKLSFIL